jgi:hypothetical protein
MYRAVHGNGIKKDKRDFHMAEIDSVIINTVQSFLNKLRLTGFHISKAYIFGSYVKGQVNK